MINCICAGPCRQELTCCCGSGPCSASASRTHQPPLAFWHTPLPRLSDCRPAHCHLSTVRLSSQLSKITRVDAGSVTSSTAVGTANASGALKSMQCKQLTEHLGETAGSCWLQMSQSVSDRACMPSRQAIIPQLSAQRPAGAQTGPQRSAPMHAGAGDPGLVAGSGCTPEERQHCRGR